MKMEVYEKACSYICRTYGVREEYPWPRFPDNRVYRDPESGKWFALFMNVERSRLGLAGDGPVPVVTLKADADFIMLAAGKDGILPAYHMNRRHWISLLLDGSVTEDNIFACIDRSWQLLTDTPSRRIYEAVKKIPRGQVATYSQIAAMAGNPRMSRAVGNALHHNPDPLHIPCHRVVNASGALSGAFAFEGPDEQAERLRAEGVEVKDGRVDLSRYQMQTRQQQ